VTREQIDSDSIDNHLIAWTKFGDQWINKFLNLKFFDDLTQVHTFSFETICKNRQGIFNDHEHIELACSYDVDRCVFVGVSISDHLFYVPHSIYETSSHIPFEQPLWWNVAHAKQVDAMIEALDSMLMGKITKIEYLTMFPPSNKNPVTDFIDPEGWVAMKIVTPSTQNLDLPPTVYSKIKTESYYRAHKFEQDNIPI